MASSADSIGIAVVEREERVVGCRQCGRNPRCRCVAGHARGGPSSRYMVWIGCSCEIRFVARIAVSRRAYEDVIYVAQSASDRSVCAGERERRVVVIEDRPGPVCRRVAGVARGGESRSSMGRVRGSIPIGLMAAIAGGRQRCVVVVRVAGRACNGRMESRQRERRGVVVKRGRTPGGCRMANRAIRRESRSDVIWICRTSKVRLMARIACGWRVCVAVIDVALRTSQRRVETGKWIVCISSVIEIDCGPNRGVVAGIAGCRERRGHVIWIRCSCPVRLVTAKAGCGQRCVVVAHVARRTRNGDVRTCERKRRLVVVEYRLRPGRGVMASLASGREARGNVIWICRPSEVRLVAAVARGRQRRVVVVHVAGRASNGDVRARKRKRRFVVVECRRGPGRSVMASLARGREARGNVIRICRPCVVGLMAGIAGCGRV